MPSASHPAMRLARYAAWTAGVVLLLWAATVFALPSNTPMTWPMVPDGTVNAIARASNGTIFIGGVFTHVGPLTGGGVPLTTATGGIAGAFPKVNGIVTAVVADGYGGWFIGGTFTGVGGVARNNIAHVQSDGSLDTTWNPNANGAVNALARSGTGLYLGGAFTTLTMTNGTTPGRNRLAEVLTTGTGNLLPWVPSSNSTVNALLLSGTGVYIGGSFGNIDGSSHPRNGAAEVLSTGTGNLLPWNPVPGGQVNALAMTGTTVYLGGTFTTMNGAGHTRNRVAAVLSYGTGNLLAWNPNLNSIVNTLLVSGTGVYIGGLFTTPRTAEAEVLTTGTGNLLPWNPHTALINGSINPQPFAFALAGKVMYIAGDFSDVNSTTYLRYGLAKVSATGTGTVIPGWDAKPGCTNNATNMRSLAVSGSVIYAGGSCPTMGSVVRDHLAAFSATGNLLPWDPNGGTGSPSSTAVNALVISGSTIYIGGGFTTIGPNGQLHTRNRVAQVTTTGIGTLTNWNPNASNTVNALAISGTGVYIGGSFATMNGAGHTRNFVAQVSATGTGNVTNWNPNPGAIVNTLLVSGTGVYIGGNFTTMNTAGNTRNHAAAVLSYGTGNLLPWNPNVNDVVNTFLLSGTGMYIGGNFATMNGAARDYVAQVSATGNGNVTNWNPNPGGFVNALLLSGTGVDMGGNFIDLNSRTRNHVAQVSATGTGNLLGWNPNLNGGPGTVTVKAMVFSGSSIIVGGNFMGVGLLAQANLAIFYSPTNSSVIVNTLRNYFFFLGF